MTQRIAYFDCFSGASGDMLLGALLDAGLSLDDLRADLAALDLSGYELQLARQVSHGLSGSRLDVLDQRHDQPARNLPAVRVLLESSKLAPEVIAASLQVFQRLAEAEAAVHGTTVDEVHFHEVGAVDTLVDIVGFCAGIRRLGIERLYASPLPLGGGTILTAHGLLPLPAPATLALLTSARAPIVPSDAQAELVTPTGAALLSTLAEFERPAMNLDRVGYGFGAKEFPWANVLRVWIGEAQEAAADRGHHDHEHHRAHHDHVHPHEGHGHDD
jgi:pyridinium-3,5-bisthiocarboxylic acid mononucleotide nickel chelatase